MVQHLKYLSSMKHVEHMCQHHSTVAVFKQRMMIIIVFTKHGREVSDPKILMGITIPTVNTSWRQNQIGNLLTGSDQPVTPTLTISGYLNTTTHQPHFSVQYQ